MNSTVLIALLIILPAIAKAADQDRSRKWLERPWKIRYVLFVSDMGIAKDRIRASRAVNARNSFKGQTLIYYYADALFLPPKPFYSDGSRAVTMTLLSFDSEGRTHSSSLTNHGWMAKHNVLDRLLLIDPAHPDAKPYRLAEWSQGIPGNDTFGPAVCAWDDSDRYLDTWRSENSAGGFGCREWTAQLYQWDRPYIDVTSYSTAGPFSGDFVGWSRLSDAPKPVIGLQGKTWLCLHECPDGEKPGIIKNMRSWTRKYGFPMPERPPKQPLYPNSDYMDDLNEFND